MDTALLVLRLMLGTVMLAHGIRHARGRSRTTAWFDSMGFRAPALQWLTSTAVEIGTGVLLIVGLATPVAAAGVVGIMVVAFWTVHRRAGFFVTARPDEGWEYVFALAAVAVALAVAGAGSVSVDAALGWDELLDGWAGAAIVAGGVVAAAGQVALFHRSAVETR